MLSFINSISPYVIIVLLIISNINKTNKFNRIKMDFLRIQALHYALCDCKETDDTDGINKTYKNIYDVNKKWFNFKWKE